MNNPRSLSALFAAVAAASCGGGGGGDSAASGGSALSSYISWQGSANGVLIVDANGDFYQVRTSDRVVADEGGTSLTGLQVDQNGMILQGGNGIGTVVMATSTSGNPIAAMRCLNGARMDVVVSSGSYRVDGCSAAPPPPPVVSTSGGGPATSAPAPASGTFVTWTGNANGTSIADSDGDFFQVRASDRVVIDASLSALRGLVVSQGGTVSFNGQTVGTVGLGRSTTGSQIAVFYCQNGSPMNIRAGGGSYSVDGCSTNPPPPVTGAPEPTPSGFGGTTPAPAPEPVRDRDYTVRAQTTVSQYLVTLQNTSDRSISCRISIRHYYLPRNSQGLERDRFYGTSLMTLVLRPGETDSDGIELIQGETFYTVESASVTCRNT